MNGVKSESADGSATPRGGTQRTLSNGRISKPLCYRIKKWKRTLIALPSARDKLTLAKTRKNTNDTKNGAKILRARCPRFPCPIFTNNARNARGMALCENGEDAYMHGMKNRTCLFRLSTVAPNAKISPIFAKIQEDCSFFVEKRVIRHFIRS